MPVMAEPPIAEADVPRLDAVIVTHIDNDHFSVPTCTVLGPVTTAFHSTHWVAELMNRHGLPGQGHDIDAGFEVGPMHLTLTPADHAWQNEFPGTDEHFHQPEDACGFWIKTPDGTIWATGDSRLI